MSEFRITVASDPDHEDLIAEIYFGDEFVALLSQENGFESIEVELHPRQNGQPHRFPLGDLQGALEKAKSRLWELRRTASVKSDS
jgi:hypothetical protein